MFEFYIKCPYCKNIHYYSLGEIGLPVRIGDVIDGENKTCAQTYHKKCLSCNKDLKFIFLIKNGKFINAFLNPDVEQLKFIKNGIFKSLKRYPETYEYPTRLNRLLGEDSQVIPEQFSINNKFKIGELVPLFKKTWRIDACYKVIDKAYRIYERVYKVSSGDIERLLIIANNQLPVLREVDWDVDYWLSYENKLRKYKLRPGFEIIMDVS